MWGTLAIDAAAIVTSGIELATEFLPFIYVVGGIAVAQRLVRSFKSMF